MSVMKGMIIAFSMYSKIPVPQISLEEKDMKYHLCFFPWVGIVIGALMLGWWYLCNGYCVGSLCTTLVGTAIPIAVTGGFHVDGYMDTMDAFCSYQSQEKKLEILKDSHIGAFSVIMVILYYLLYAGFFSEIKNADTITVIALGFVLSRCLSGIGVVTFQGAKSEGMLFSFANSAHRKIVKISLYIQLFIVAVVMLWVNWKMGIAGMIGAFCSFGYYYYKSKKELGGITGDTAGFFVTLCEEVILILVVVTSIMI